jgi:hypothetical protein
MQYGDRVPEGDPCGYYRGSYMAEVHVEFAQRVFVTRSASSIASKDLFRYIKGEVARLLDDEGDHAFVHNTGLYVYQNIIRQRFLEGFGNIGSVDSIADTRY